MSNFMAAHVAIFSHAQDLHGHLVADRLRCAGHVCHLVATDQMAYSDSMSWYSHQSNGGIKDIDGARVNLAQLSAVWWRRSMGAMHALEDADAEAKALIPGECRSALLGALFSDFSGRWVNDPAAEIRGDNKLVQLAAARAAGLAVPNTLVSAQPESIRSFVVDQGGQAVVKVVRGTAAFSVPARKVTAADLLDDDALKACPAIYQEIITGNSHLRIHVFGSSVYAVRIESPHLDWRPDLNVPMQLVSLPPKLQKILVGLVTSLGLAMGIIDAKLAADGGLVFLEINPQGQFAFIEGLTGVPLSAHMADFLAEPVR